MAQALPLIALAVVGAVAGGATAYGNYQQAKTEQKGLDAQARIARQNAYARERAARRAGMLAVKRQQLAVSKGGLLLEGSPLEQLAANTFEVEYNALSERNAGLNESAYLRWQGHIGKQTARRAIGTSIVLGGISGAAQGYSSFGGSAKTTSGAGARVASTAVAVGPSSAASLLR